MLLPRGESNRHFTVAQTLAAPGTASSTRTQAHPTHPHPTIAPPSAINTPLLSTLYNSPGHPPLGIYFFFCPGWMAPTPGVLSVIALAAPVVLPVGVTPPRILPLDVTVGLPMCSARVLPRGNSRAAGSGTADWMVGLLTGGPAASAASGAAVVPTSTSAAARAAAAAPAAADPSRG